MSNKQNIWENNMAVCSGNGGAFDIRDRQGSEEELPISETQIHIRRLQNLVFFQFLKCG